MSGNGLTPECVRKDCDYEAAWIPVILIPSPIENPTQKRGRLFVHSHDVCQRHKESLRITDFLGVGAWEDIRLQIIRNGKTPPREEDLELEWSPVLEGRT